MRPIESQKQLITAAVTGALGDLLSGVGDGLPKARPLPGKAGVIIEWPRIEWPTWNTDDPDVTWTLVIVAGTPATQAAQQALLVDCAQRIAGALNVATADPVTVDLPNGAGSVAGYRITLNPM